MTENNIYGELYDRAKRGDTFKKLMQLVISRENILLAYRNIKSNIGSKTAGTDKLTINDIKMLTAEEVVDICDRLIQQCFKQVIEPICEAKFSRRSNKNESGTPALCN